MLLCKKRVIRLYVQAWIQIHSHSIRVLYLLRKKETLIRSLCCPSVCLSVKILYLRNASRYRDEIQTIYSDLRSLDFLKQSYCFNYLKKDKAVYTAQNTYFDTIKGVKIHRLPVDLELWQLASIGNSSSGKKSVKN